MVSFFPHDSAQRAKSFHHCWLSKMHMIAVLWIAVLVSMARPTAGLAQDSLRLPPRGVPVVECYLYTDGCHVRVRLPNRGWDQILVQRRLGVWRGLIFKMWRNKDKELRNSFEATPNIFVECYVHSDRMCHVYVRLVESRRRLVEHEGDLLLLSIPPDETRADYNYIDLELPVVERGSDKPALINQIR
jgi:hypothetical protein